MKWLRIFFYPFYNTCQTVQNINIFQSVCFLPKSHIQPVLGYTYIEIQRWPVLWGNCLCGWPSFSWCYIPCPLIAVLYFLSPSSSASGFNDFFLRMKVAYFTYSQIIRHLCCNESVVSNLTDFSQFNSDTSANQKTRQQVNAGWLVWMKARSVCSAHLTIHVLCINSSSCWHLQLKSVTTRLMKLWSF